MDLMGRTWHVRVCEEHRQIVGHGACRCITNPFSASRSHSVEVVPAEQLRGAVEALDSIADVLDRGIPDDRKLATVVRLVHAARSTTSGGQ